MKKNEYCVSPHAISKLLRREWNIQADFVRMRKVPLKEFGITVLEVNWLLNAIEWKYEVEIEEVELSLQATLEEVFQLILKARKKGIKTADRSAYQFTRSAN